MSNLPIQFQDKENSPALLAYLQQFGEKSYLSAEEINQIRDAINELAQGSLPDAVLKTGTISITGLAVNIAANAFAWRINQQSFLNPPSYGVNLTAAANGFYRADIIVGTSTGTYQVVQGNPSATTAIEPNTPEGTIRLAGVVVFGMVVGQPTPTLITNFIQKSERANVVLTGSGVINQLNLVDEKATIVFKDAITRLNTISYASVPYNGKTIRLFNAQATPVTIGHSVSGFGVDFVFPDAQDYILLPNQTIEFSFDITYAPYAHHMLIGSKGIATWSELQGKPSTFPPSAHTHTKSQITDFAHTHPISDVTGLPTALDDLQLNKEDKSNKGAPNGYAPLDEFTKLAAQYLNIVNDLVTGGATALLSAEQGKVLQTQVSAINTLLTSDNVNLDTVQELVDAIETVQLSLSTILVNDLTTGGTTKALTAEMGKLLQANKVEKVTGKSLLSDTEITRLGTMTITSDAEMQAGTDNTKYSTALRIATWFTWIKTQAQTWVAKQTFTLAPRFSSTTASQFLKVDSNKDLASVSEASDAEMQAGTDNTKPITALRNKTWFTWRLTQPFTFGNLAGTGNRVVQVNSSGNASASYNIQDGFTTDSDVITALTGATYNSGNNYTATITPANSKVFNQGQFYRNAGVIYFATADNQASRITLS